MTPEEVRIWLELGLPTGMLGFVLVDSILRRRRLAKARTEPSLPAGSQAMFQQLLTIGTQLQQLSSVLNDLNRHVTNVERSDLTYEADRHKELVGALHSISSRLEQIERRMSAA